MKLVSGNLSGNFSITEAIVSSSWTRYVTRYDATLRDSSKPLMSICHFSDGYIENGHKIPDLNNPSVDEYYLGPDVLGHSIQYLECKNSRKTPHWASRQATRVDTLKLTKQKHSMVRPIEPLFRLPRPIFPTKPKISYTKYEPLIRRSIRNKESTLSFKFYLETMRRLDIVRSSLLADRDHQRQKRLLATWKKNVLSIRRIQALYKASFLLRVAKYKVRIKRYEASLLKSQQLTFSKDSTRHSIQPDNPYGHIELVAVGLNRVSRKWRVGYTYPEDPFMRPAHDHFMNFESSFDDSSSSAHLLDLAEASRVFAFAAVEEHLADIENRLVRKIYSKLGNQQIHVGNLLAERKQTFDMFQDLFKRIMILAKAKTHILKAVLAFVKSPKAIANDVLAFKFGIEPLMKDLEALGDKLVSLKADEPFVVVRTNFGGQRLEPLKVLTPAFDFDGTIVVSYVVKLSIDSPVTRSLQSFGLINSAEILWEVTPWSFVVDWLIPIGSWIASQTAVCGLTFVTGTRKVKLKGTFDFKQGAPESFLFDPASSGSYGRTILGSFIGEMVDRTVITKLPSAFRLPSIKNPWSWSHGIEALALLVQRIKLR